MSRHHETFEGLCENVDTETQSYIFNQTMLRIKDPQISLDFYTIIIGMKLYRKLDFFGWNWKIEFLEKLEKLGFFWKIKIFVKIKIFLKNSKN